MATYLVTQATGGQAQAVIKHLLAAGAKVHAVVRDPTKTLPSILQNPAVTVFKGNSDNVDEIFQAAQGCKGVFLNTFPIPGLEEQQAQSVVDAAKKTGSIESIVASTSFATGDRSLWDDEATKKAGLHGYYSSKAVVEDIVKASGLSYTFLRPGFIHFDYLAGHTEMNWTALSKGELDHDYEDSARMPHTVADDIGRYAAAALLDPAKFRTAGIDLLGESLTMEETAAIVSRVAGREVKARKRSTEEREALLGKLFVQGFHFWANVKDFSPLLRAAKQAEAKYGIKFTPVEEALKEDRDLLLAVLT